MSPRLLPCFSNAFVCPPLLGQASRPNALGTRGSVFFAMLFGAASGLAACSSTEAASTSAAATTVTLAVEGMTCGDCEQAIRDAVSKLPGVVRCTASHVEKSAVVELVSGATVAPEEIAETVRRLGYTVTLTAPPSSQPPPSR